MLHCVDETMPALCDLFQMPVSVSFRALMSTFHAGFTAWASARFGWRMARSSLSKGLLIKLGSIQCALRSDLGGGDFCLLSSRKTVLDDSLTQHLIISTISSSLKDVSESECTAQCKLGSACDFLKASICRDHYARLGLARSADHHESNPPHRRR